MCARVHSMARLVIYLFVICTLLLCQENVRHSGATGGWRTGVADATNGHGSQLEGRDRHHHERGGHIRREFGWVEEMKKDKCFPLI